MAKKLPPLGETQKAFLKALVQHGSWTTGGRGWAWSNESETTRIAESLRKRGLAYMHVSSAPFCLYAPTQLGIDEARVRHDPYGRKRKKFDEIAAGKRLHKPDWKAQWLSLTDEQREYIVSQLMHMADADGWGPDLLNSAIVAAKLLEAIGKGG